SLRGSLDLEPRGSRPRDVEAVALEVGERLAPAPLELAAEDFLAAHAHDELLLEVHERLPRMQDHLRDAAHGDVDLVVLDLRLDRRDAARRDLDPVDAPRGLRPEEGVR